MNQAEYQQARKSFLAGDDPSASLLAVCREAVVLVATTSGLPAAFSPYGVWSREAIDEVNADWTAARLIERGQLRAMLQRAPLLRVFRRMAETSVRQHLIDRNGRSQLGNLRQRVRELLEQDERFTATDGVSSAASLWQLQGSEDGPFQGDDRTLLALACSLGSFTVVRYDLDARKLSPLLETSELDRFVTDLLRAGGPMSLSTLVRALQLRFVPDAAGGAAQELSEQVPAAAADPAQRIEAEDAVTGALSELTARQVQVLRGLESGTSVREQAEQLSCSTGTVSAERGRIAGILARYGADDPRALNLLFEALF